MVYLANGKKLIVCFDNFCALSVCCELEKIENHSSKVKGKGETEMGSPELHLWQSNPNMHWNRKAGAPALYPVQV